LYGENVGKVAQELQITHAQAATIDSIMLTYRDESGVLLARGDAMIRSVSGRQALRRKYQAAIGQVLTPMQKAAYDSWYFAAEAAFETKRPRGPSTP
jgi:Spy/CpxP family protein refolding chaperone